MVGNKQWRLVWDEAAGKVIQLAYVSGQTTTIHLMICFETKEEALAKIAELNLEYDPSDPDINIIEE